MERKCRCSKDIIDLELGFIGERILNKKTSRRSLVPSGSVKDHFHDYCMSTSIHGVRYLGEKDRPLGERLWWMFIFILCLVGNSYLIGKVWTKWSDSPVIVSFAETTTPVWQVPFPAVTICPEVKSSRDVFDFTVAYHSTEMDLMEEKSAMSMVCDGPIIIKNASHHITETYVNFLVEAAPVLNHTLQYCKWKGNPFTRCINYFNPVITEDGLCYTFNVLSDKELFRKDLSMKPYPGNLPESKGWTLDTGYEENTPLETYPNRALDAGTKAGLFILIVGNLSDHDNVCRGPIPGYKILLHNPAEIPSVGERYFRIPIDQEVLVAVEPEIMTTSQALRHYDPHRRQCYFPSERYLKYFQVYTQRNCELECLTNFTLIKCGCVGLYMPRENQTLVCGGGKKKCMHEANMKLRYHEIEASYAGSQLKSCDCIPACASLEYKAEISQANFNWQDVIKNFNDNDTDYSTMSRVSIFFKDMQFVTSRRSELFGPVDFLANCGGLLGLFSGFSLLSLVEIVYYITLRFWSNVKKNRRHHRESISKIEIEERNVLD